MKRLPMLSLAMSVVLALALLGAPLTAWAGDGEGAGGDPSGANLGALIALVGVLAILTVGGVYMAWGEPEEEENDH